MRILWYIVLAALVLMVPPAIAQKLESQLSIPGGSLRVERPSSMAVAPGGERIAISDLSTNQISVVDLQGRLIWVSGDQVRLNQPGALCFESDSRILFVPTGSLMLLSVSEENPREVDTVRDFSSDLPNWRSVDQIVREHNHDGYRVMNSYAGEVAVFDKDWEFEEIIISRGSGKGRVLLPTGLAITSSGKMVVVARKNYPVQFFAPDGKFLVYGGWNEPSQERGWEAVALAVDTRDFVWVADETNSQYRIFDQSGTLVSKFPFLNPAVAPIAMAGTIDNRMAVLEQTGSLLFYTLE